MTDKEAYELMVKYSGDQGLVKIRQMIHEIGVEGTVDLMIESYVEAGMNVSVDFKEWMRQGYQYLSNQMSKPLN